jgi:hypothetical protein
MDSGSGGSSPQGGIGRASDSAAAMRCAGCGAEAGRFGPEAESGTAGSRMARQDCSSDSKSRSSPWWSEMVVASAAECALTRSRSFRMTLPRKNMESVVTEMSVQLK